MTSERGTCLGAQEIVAYLDRGLTERRRAEIDRHLDECRLCGEAVEGVAGLEWREGYLRSTESLRARVRARTAAAVTAAAVRHPPVARFRPARPAPFYLTLAASLIVGVGAAVVLTRPGPGETLFQDYFEPYPSTRPTVRGAVQDASSDAMARYEAGDYRGALAALEGRLQQPPDDPATRFYAGVCRLALGRTREATLDLEQVLLLGEKELHTPAEWYLALIHLRGEDPAEARPHLERIAGAGGFYQDKARALLSQLDRLEKRD
jgi:tetratricopeptide (TPR) repeat protein